MTGNSDLQPDWFGLKEEVAKHHVLMILLEGAKNIYIHNTAAEELIQMLTVLIVMVLL